MKQNLGGAKVIRYSEAFKLEVVRELESSGLAFGEVRRKYGIRGAWTVQYWVRKYGNGTRGKVIRVQKPEEIDELKQLKGRIRMLEIALANSNVELVVERAYTRLACERAGITDLEGFKKKAAGQLPTKG